MRQISKKQVQTRVDWLRLNLINKYVEVNDVVSGLPVKGKIEELVVHYNEDDISVSLEIVEDNRVRYRTHSLEEVNLLNDQ